MLIPLRTCAAELVLPLILVTTQLIPALKHVLPKNMAIQRQVYAKTVHRHVLCVLLSLFVRPAKEMQRWQSITCAIVIVAALKNTTSKIHVILPAQMAPILLTPMLTAPLAHPYATPAQSLLITAQVAMTGTTIKILV